MTMKATHHAPLPPLRAPARRVESEGDETRGKGHDGRGTKTNSGKKMAARGEGDGTHGRRQRADEQRADDDTTPRAPSLSQGAETPALPVREGIFFPFFVFCN